MNSPNTLPSRIRTPRLVLVPYTPALLHAEIAGPEFLAEMLDVPVPPFWPPPLNDEASQRYFLGMLESENPPYGWCGWYVLFQTDDGPELVGNSGFKGPPAPDGSVEIGYSVVPDRQRQGIATEVARALCDWAFGKPQVTAVYAHTLPGDEASGGVLLKCGFTDAGPASEDGVEVTRFKLARPDCVR